MPNTLEYASYDDLCLESDVEGLASASSDAIARVSPQREIQPEPPRDAGGGFDPNRDAASSRLPESWWNAPFTSPELYAVCLHGALCFGGKARKLSRQTGRHEGGALLVAGDRYLVSDSFVRRDRSRTLSEDLLPLSGQSNDKWTLDADLDGVAQMPGRFYLIGNAMVGQFGHFLLEGLSRLWFSHLVDGSDLRFVIYEPKLKGWQRVLLDVLGIPRDRIVHVDQPTRFEQLIVPARAFLLHQQSSAEQDRVWERIGDHFADRGEPERIYLSRSQFPKRRSLVNEEEVERLFAERGFRIVHPQQLPIGDQIALARRAEMIAGSAGSGMYLSAFQAAGAAKFIISPRSFTFRDDQLISHFRDGSLWYFITADEEHSTAGAGARQANYGVDARRLADGVDEWIASEGERAGAGAASPRLA